MAKRRFELVEGTSRKFWEVNLAGSSFTVTFGRIGTDGQSKVKKCRDAAAAKAEVEKLLAEKTQGTFGIESRGARLRSSARRT